MTGAAHLTDNKEPEDSSPVAAAETVDNPAYIDTTQRYIKRVKKLIWLYFWLLLFEGALRKWVAPALANPILLIRDPIVLGIYYNAYRAGRLPRNAFVIFGTGLAWISLVAGLMVLVQAPLVPIYGFRADFLHLFLIFVMPLYFDAQDVRKMGRLLLLLAIPMALLMIVQFKSPSASWINSGSDESFTQIGTARGHIRSPGTFSFISGPICFYALCAAFLLEGLSKPRQYPRWLVLAASLAVGLGTMVSGSRSTLLAVVIVLVCALLNGVILQPRLMFRTVQSILLLCIVGGILAQIPDVREGLATLNERFSGKDVTEGGFVTRIVEGLSIKPQAIYEVPLLGYGLGVGTNVGAVLNTGVRNGFAYGENEWERLISEGGPVLGLLFILLRCLIALYLCFQAVREARKGNELPLLIFSASCLMILNGQWGQATSQGFAALGGGLCLASMQTKEESIDTERTQAI